MSFSVVTNPDNSSQMTPPNNYPGFFQEQSNQNQPRSNNQQSAQNAQANKSNLANLAAMAASKATTSKMPDNVIRGDSGSFHSYSTEQKVAFAEFVNIALTGDPDLADDLPINVNDDSLFEIIKKGIVLPKLINLIEPNCVKNITIKKNMNNFEILTNHTATLKAAKELGCSIVNIGESDIMEKKYHLVLGLIWQILDKVLLKKVSLKYHPEILAMLKDNDNLETFIREDPQEKLMRWVNYQLANENSNRRIKNFREDLSDGIVYLDLIRHISPKDAKDKINEFMNNNHQRIQKLRDSPRPSNQLNAYPNNENSGSANKDAENNADPFCIELINFILNVSRVYLKVFGFVTASSIIAKNDTMNITFISSLFHHYPCLGLNQDKVRVESIIRNKLKDLSESPESIGKMIEQFESNCLIQQHNEPIPLFQFNPNNAIHVRPNASGNVPPPDDDKITSKLEEPPSKNTNNVYTVNREELTSPVENKPNVFDCPDLQQNNFQANYQNMNPGDGNFYNNNNNNYQNCDYANGRDNFYMNNNNNNNNNNQYGNTYGNQYDNNNNNNNPYQSQYGPQNGNPNSYNTNFQNNFSNPYQNPYYNPYSGGNYPLLNTNQGNLNQFTPQYGNNYTQSNIYCNPPPWTQTQTTISTVYMAPPPPQQIVSTSVVQLIPDEVVYIVEDLN